MKESKKLLRKAIEEEKEILKKWAARNTTTQIKLYNLSKTRIELLQEELDTTNRLWPD